MEGSKAGDSAKVFEILVEECRWRISKNVVETRYSCVICSGDKMVDEVVLVWRWILNDSENVRYAQRAIVERMGRSVAD